MAIRITGNRQKTLRLRLIVLSVVFAVICKIGCGRSRDHVYRSRLVGHYVAYFQDRQQPQSADTLDLNENGSCFHGYRKAGETARTEASCSWTLTDKTDGTWLRFDGLSNGIHRQCTVDCVIEGAAWDAEFVTRVELPETPSVFYAK